eukprot:1758273-Rhodomonas_salina.1
MTRNYPHPEFHAMGILSPGPGRSAAQAGNFRVQHYKTSSAQATIVIASVTPPRSHRHGDGELEFHGTPHKICRVGTRMPP